MIKLFFAFLFTAATAGLMANDSPLRISPSNKWVIVEKKKSSTPSMRVVLRQADGKILVHETIRKTTKYNLKFVQDGQYTLEIEDYAKIVLQDISIDNGQLITEGSKITFKPHFVAGEGRLDMNLMTQGKAAKLTFRTDDGKTLKEEDILNEVSVTRRFNTASLEKGHYFIDVQIDGQTFTHEYVK
jgi:hypothetical protein